MPPAVAPADLHFLKLADPVDGIDQFSDRFSVVGPDDFTLGQLGDLYDTINFSGSTAPPSYGNGQCVIPAGPNGEVAYQSKTQPIAPYVWAEMEVDSWTDGTAATVGFIKSSNTFLRWDVHFTGTPYPQKVGLHGKINGGGVPGQSFTPANPHALVAVLPFKIRCVLAWPEWWGWIEDVNGNRPIMRGNLSSPDLRLLTQFAGWKPFFGCLRFQPGATMIAAKFRTGYTGGIRVRDFKPVTMADGRPYVDSTRPTRRYFSTTCATGFNFKTNHLSVMSVDVETADARLESIIFFDVANGDRTNPLATKDMRTSLYGGQIVRSPDDTKWILVVNGWGLGDAATGVGLWYAETPLDITDDPGIVSLGAHLLTLYSFVPQTLSFYDNSFRWDENVGRWKFALTKPATPTNWSHYFPAVYEGPDLNNLVQVAQAQSYKAEGTCWSRVGGTWYVTAGGVDGPHFWTEDLGEHGNLLANLDLTGLNTSFSTYGSHFFIMPVETPSGTHTQYFALLFSNDQYLSTGVLATKGKLTVMCSDELYPGTEF